MKRGGLKSALGGFLGTYTSRYTHWRGYWLFGFVVEDIDGVSFDLLGESEAPEQFFVAIAAAEAHKKFVTQLARNGFPRERVVAARLDFVRGTVLHRWQPYGCEPRVGYEVRFVASATADSGWTLRRERCLLIAPHDPRLEMASGGCQAESD